MKYTYRVGESSTILEGTPREIADFIKTTHMSVSENIVDSKQVNDTEKSNGQDLAKKTVSNGQALAKKTVIDTLNDGYDCGFKYFAIAQKLKAEEEEECKDELIVVNRNGFDLVKRYVLTEFGDDGTYRSSRDFFIRGVTYFNDFNDLKYIF